MSDRPGQEGPTPDFIPGWFARREEREGQETELVEAVRIPEVGDHFPVTFLRSDERVGPAPRPQLGFTISPKTPDSIDSSLGVPPGFWIVRRPSEGNTLTLWRHHDFEEKWTRSDLRWVEARDREPEPGVLRDNPHLPPGFAEKLTADLAAGEGWKGTPPAHGTRRRLILDTIERFKTDHGNHPSSRELADAVESALLQTTIDDEAMARGAEALMAGITKVDPITPRGPGLSRSDSIEGFCADQRASHHRLRVDDPGFREYHRGAETSYTVLLEWLDKHPNRTITPSPIHEVLDRADVPRTGPGDGGPRPILTLSERVQWLVHHFAARQHTIDGLGELVGAQADLRVEREGKVPAGTREVHVVIGGDDRVEPAKLFVELEDEKGRGLGCFRQVADPDDPTLSRIVIPYGRDDAWISEIAHQAGGAVSGVFLREDPDKVMPAEECAAAVATILTGFGIKAPGDHVAEESLESGRHETSGQVWPKGSPEYRRVMAGASSDAGGDDPAAVIKYLEGEVERLLGGREEARTGESRYAEERDCAFALLRWLLPVTVAKRID